MIWILDNVGIDLDGPCLRENGYWTQIRRGNKRQSVSSQSGCAVVEQTALENQPSTGFSRGRCAALNQNTTISAPDY